MAAKQVLDIVPVSAPRMTQRDRWAKRPPVLRYFAFREHIQLLKASVAESGDTVTFVLPMPKSWSKKKREAMDGAPHQQKPDVDNLTKALLDSIFEDDSHVHDIHTRKVWGVEGSIVIESEKGGTHAVQS